MPGLTRFIATIAGAGLVVWVLRSAVRTVVLPRDEAVALTRALFRALKRIFDLRIRPGTTYARTDHVMSMYAPLALVMLPGVWVALIIAGFTAIFWGMGVDPLLEAFELSGSSMLTLGTHQAPDLPTHVATFVEATLGLGVVALLISYLPSIYAAFQRRELLVTKLVTRAGEPPGAITMLRRHHALSRFDALDASWPDWETWFADVEETHTSQPSLVFFRSISPERSWVTSAGVVLDTAALRVSTLDLPLSADAQLTLRAGFLCLRRIAGYFSIPFDADPSPTDPISVRRDEFDAAYDEMASVGVPLRRDRDQCWRDFQGWRVNYDSALLALAGLTNAPMAQWSSDRATHPRLGRIGLSLRRHNS